METEKSSSIEEKSDKQEKPKKKASRGPDKITVLEQRIEQLEYTIRMMAHFNGTNRVLDECKIERWEPSKKHLRRA